MRRTLPALVSVLALAATLMSVPAHAATVPAVPAKPAGATSPITPPAAQPVAVKGTGKIKDSCKNIGETFKRMKAKRGQRKQATCITKLTAGEAEARAKKADATSLALSGEGPDNSIPADCEVVSEKWVFHRTWTCRKDPYVTKVEQEVQPGVVELVGELSFDVAQYAYTETTSPDLYDGIGKSAGNANMGAPTGIWNYRVEVRRIPGLSWGLTQNATVTAAAHWCEAPDTDKWQCDSGEFTPWKTFDQVASTDIINRPLNNAVPVAVGTWWRGTSASNPGEIAWTRPNVFVEITVPEAINRTAGFYPDSPALLRCDSVASRVSTGCVYKEYKPSMRYALDGDWADYPELAWHVKEAQQGHGVPGKTGGGPLPGDPEGVPLTRIATTDETGNRAAACKDSLDRPDGDSCDEYPMNSTAEGAATGSYSCRMINEDHNETGGAKLGWFYDKQHVLPGDKFFVEIVGDDYTGSRTWSPNNAGTCSYPTTQTPSASTARTALNLTAANRRGAVPGVYDWSRAGYLAGTADLPSASSFSTSDNCVITAAEFQATYQNYGGGGDASAGFQKAIDDIKAGCSATAGFNKLSLIELPPGDIRITKQIYVDADYLVIRGSGSDPATGTRITFEPDADTRYDTITEDGSNWDKDAMTSGDGKGGWIWPGRGLFRVQSRTVHPDYQDDYDDAEPNRKDLFEGTVNVHWKAGAKLRDKPGDTGFAARTGDTKIYIRNDTNSKIRANLIAGKYVNIRAANTMNFYRQMAALPTDFPLQSLQMRQQIFRITGVGTSSSDRWITIDKPLEYDVPVTSESDGSEPIPCDVDCPSGPVDSKASPLVDPVEGVGFENMYITQYLPGKNATSAIHNYGNMDPAAEMNGIVFKWAVNDWVKGVQMHMTGSHPIVTEEAKNLTIADNYLDGAWNKGKGGNGYFRGSRVWDSV